MAKPCRCAAVLLAFEQATDTHSDRRLQCCQTAPHSLQAHLVCAAWQVLGVTNYSHWKEAAAVRSCMQGSASTQQLLLSLSLKQLQQFVHVGVLDMLDESIAALAVSLTDSLSVAANVPCHFPSLCIWEK